MRGRRGVLGSKAVNHVGQDIKHIHDDVTHVMRAHAQEAEVGTHLEEVDEHLHKLVHHAVDFGAAAPLAFFPEGAEGRIVRLAGGRGLTQRLADMGFVPGTKVKVLSAHYPGPILVDIKGSRVALGRGVAMKIMVRD